MRGLCYQIVLTKWEYFGAMCVMTLGGFAVGFLVAWRIFERNL